MNTDVQDITELNSLTQETDTVSSLDTTCVREAYEYIQREETEENTLEVEGDYITLQITEDGRINITELDEFKQDVITDEYYPYVVESNSGGQFSTANVELYVGDRDTEDAISVVEAIHDEYNIRTESISTFTRFDDSSFSTSDNLILVGMVIGIVGVTMSIGGMYAVFGMGVGIFTIVGGMIVGEQMMNED